MKNLYKLIVSIVLCQMAGILGAVFTAPSINSWYLTLNKPAITPPGWLFGPAWTFLYLLMGISLYLVWVKNWEVKPASHGWPHKAWNRYSEKLINGPWKKANIIAIFWIQLFLNFLWSVLFFSLHLPGAAFFELLMLWVAILYTIVNFWRVSKTAGCLLLPYIAWVTFAGYLNYLLWILN